MKRYDCLERLASWVDEHTLAVTSNSSNAAIWTHVYPGGPSFSGLNLGLCLPFALGVSLAFPRRTVLAIDGDGSVMVDASALITVADAAPPNLVVLVFDNERYARMGSTATAHRTDLAGMARAAGIPSTATVRDTAAFEREVKLALRTPGPHFLAVKVEPEQGRLFGDQARIYGGPMKLRYQEALEQLPDFGRWRDAAPA